jgi:hypothetical protein
MLRKTVVVLAIALVLGSSALSTSAFARGGGFGSNHFGGGFGGGRMAGAYGGYGDRLSGLHGGFHHGYERRDLWGHWGGYYGPMI